ELGEAGARGRVLHLVVDVRPDRVELAQPGEQVGLLRQRARERLEQVVVGVDEPGRDDRPAEVEEFTLLLPRTGCAGAVSGARILAGGGWLTPHPGWGHARVPGSRRVAGAQLGDQAVLDPEPAALVLGAGVVHRHDPGVREDHEASSGTSSNRST